MGTHRSEFTYDGQQRRVRVVENENSGVQSDTNLVWCGVTICEERAAAVVIRRAFSRGEQAAGVSRFFVRDQVWSVRDITDSTGAAVGRYSFDPYGRRTATVGSATFVEGFTGHYTHGAGADELSLALYRAYNADVGRWLSDAPSGLQGGINLYRYGANNPVKTIDALGLKITAHRVSREYRNVPETPCGTDGCTKADYQFEASPCQPMKNCAGKWKFDGSVRLLIRVWFARDPNVQYEAGKTLRQHECEGFSSRPECERVRTGWLNWLRQVFSDFDQLTGGRDR